MKKRIHRLMHRKHVLLPKGRDTVILPARVSRSLLKRVELFARMELRTRSNMVEVMLERYIRCPSCQRRGTPDELREVKS